MPTKLHNPTPPIEKGLVPRHPTKLEQEGMVEIRCPFKVTTKRGMTYTCNRLTVKVGSGSTGEAFCSSCKLTFGFEVKDSSYKTSVKVKK